MTDKNTDKDERKYNFKLNIKFIIDTFIVGLIVFILNQYFVQICFIQGDSMQPTLKEGNFILIKKIDLNLDYNDIVVIKKNKNTIIKRLVALPGDKIKIDNYLYINGKKKNIVIKYPGITKDEISLGEKEYFVLGDNIQNSIDSRYSEIGIIYEKEIIGKMIDIQIMYY